MIDQYMYMYLINYCPTRCQTCPQNRCQGLPVRNAVTVVGRLLASDSLVAVVNCTLVTSFFCDFNVAIELKQDISFNNCNGAQCAATPIGRLLVFSAAVVCFLRGVRQSTRRCH